VRTETARSTAAEIAARQRDVSDPHQAAKVNSHQPGNREIPALHCADREPESEFATGVLAEGVGFEPTVRSRVQRFSRPPRSTAPASLRGADRVSGRV
jgi:hypothetical protein